jgi:TolB-like protein/tRNA A-37 threonylcarbamoyl transferase component Bud32/Tfp pilus assembly protein PilF
MKTAAKICQNCGEKIFGDAPKGLCPACVLETGLGPLVDEAVGGVGDPGYVDKLPRDSAAARGPEVPIDFGDYQLLEEIGRGGQGVVYRAHQRSLNRTVALKVIGLGQWATKAHLKRFHLEAEAAASLDHACIVPIDEVGEREGSCYFSMKFIDGGQLDEVAKRKPISVRNAAELIAKLARTVHHAHAHGILHRDIKPGNILIDAKGEPHLTDFGLARLAETQSTLTRTMDVLGTPSYMAPEQASGQNEQVTRATDVYGLGAVFYQLLTGHAPFAGGTTYETIRLLLESEPRQPRLWNPNIDRNLATICLKCLEKNPQRRYSSALALAEDLEHWLRHEPVRARHTGIVTRGERWLGRNRKLVATGVACLLLGAAVIWFFRGELVRMPLFERPEKSIAVLPFSNLSKEEENAFFADGVQGEILTDMARIADLKVIGRVSVMQYKSGVARNLRKIGQQLGVANVVEGSVQRAGNRVRVNVRLVDARTDRHLWGQTYDRDLADVFAIQSEIAKAIADELHAKLSQNERSEIERPATNDVTAFDLYTRAMKLVFTPGLNASARPDWLQAADLLNQAVARDPSFFRAYCQIAYAHDALYFFGHDHTLGRLAMAEAAVQAAFHLRPGAGEAHLARAWNLYWGYLDYDGALAELEVARQTLPNDPQIFYLTGLIQRRQGHWEDSIRTLERAADLDPRNFEVLQAIAGNHATLGRYAEQQLWLRRVLGFEPNNAGTKVILAEVDLEWRADTQPLHQMIDSVRATNPAEVPGIANWWLECALAERDAGAAKDALIAAGENPINLGNDVFSNPAFVEAVIARMAKDDEKAREAFTAARSEQEKIVQAQPDFGPPWCVLGLIDAALGRKEEALREGRRAVELLPVEKDAIRGPAVIKCLAMIAAWVGDKDLACQQLAIIVRPPSPITYGQLKLLPFWDPLRGDPCFEKIVASLAPKETQVTP